MLAISDWSRFQFSFDEKMEKYLGRRGKNLSNYSIQ